MRNFSVLVFLILVFVLISVSGALAQPLPPVLLSPSDGAQIVIPTFSWELSSGASYYEIQVADNPAFSPVIWTESTYDLEITPASTLPNGTFYWRVRSLESDDTIGDWSVIRSFSKQIPVPQMILPAPGASLVVPSFSWEMSLGAAAYHVQVASEETFSDPLLDEVTYDLSFTPAVSFPHGWFYWRVSGQDADGNLGTWSDGRSFQKTIPAPLLDKPQPYETLVTPVFSWLVTEGASDYQLQVASDPVFTTVLLDEITYDRQFTPVSTLPNGLLYWRVAARDTDGRAGEWSAVRSFSKIIPAVSLLSPAFDAALSLPTFSWQAAEGAVDYRIQIAVDAGFSDPIWDEITLDLTITPVDIDLFPSGEYWWRVIPRDADGHEGETGAVRRFSMLAPSTCTNASLGLSAPSNGNILSGEPNFSWNCRQGANRYKILIYEGTTQRAYAYTEFTAYTPFYSVSGSRETLLNGTFTWKVEAYANNTLLETSPTWTFTKNAALSLLEPGSEAALESDPNFTWQPLAGAQKYRLLIFKDSLQVAYAYTEYIAYTPFYYVSGSRESLENGAYTWKVEAQTSAGELIASSEARGFSKNTPAVLLTPPDEVTSPYDPDFSWQLVEGAQDYRISIYQDSVQSAYAYVEYNAYTPYYRVSGSKETLLNGVYTWKVEANDSGGRVITTSPIRTFTKNASVSLLAPTDGTIISHDPSFRWQPVVGALRYRIYLYRSGVQYAYDYPDYTSYTPYYHASGNKETLEEGDYTWKIQALDTSGNVITESDLWSFTIGATTPTPTNTPIGWIPSATPTPTPTAAPPPPVIHLNHTDGCAGSRVTVSGQGFPYSPGSGYGDVKILFNGKQIATAQTAPEGSFSQAILIPQPSGSGGQNTITAADSAASWAVATTTYRTPRLALPVILIPGVSGSRLIARESFSHLATSDPNLFPDESLFPEFHFYFSGEPIWLDTNGIEEAITDRSRYFDVLGLRWDGVSSDFPKVGVNDILWDIDIPGNYKDIYQGLRNFLTGELGYIEGQTFFTYPYDWRKDISSNRLALQAKINEAILSSGQDLSSGKVLIIAHSMGGLVARDYLLANGTAQVDQVISIGTPYLGSPKLVKVLETGDSWGVGMDTAFGWVGLHAMEVRKLSQNFPSAYQLSPPLDWFTAEDLFEDPYDPTYLYINGEGQDYDQTSAFISERHNDYLYNDAVGFHAQGIGDMSMLTDEYFAQRIIAVDRSTIARLDYTPPRRICVPFLGCYSYGEDLVPSWNATGDGTVPLHSAMGANVQDDRYYSVTGVSHVAMPNDATVQDYLRRMLAGTLCSNSQLMAFQQTQAAASVPSGLQVTVFGPAGLRICQLAGKCAELTALEPMSSETSLPGVSYLETRNGTTAMLEANGTYQLSLSGKQPDSAAQIRLQKLENGQVTQSAVFESVPITTTTVATLTVEVAVLPPDLALQLGYQPGDPVQSIPIASLLSGQAAYDLTPPQTAIQVDAKRQVSLSAKDEPGGSGIQAIYYSLDGPQTGFHLYNTPVTLPPDKNLVWAYSVDKARNYSLLSVYPPEHLYLPMTLRQP